MIVHVHLVRHGQTFFNRYNRLQGWSNSPLTQAGLDDAIHAGNALKDITFAAAYCSDTTRAQVTAQTILDINAANGHDVPVIHADMHFREQFYGYFEGQDMGAAWLAAGGPHGAPTYHAIVEQFGLGATRDFLKEATRSTTPSPTRSTGGESMAPSPSLQLTRTLGTATMCS